MSVRFRSRPLACACFAQFTLFAATALSASAQPATPDNQTQTINTKQAWPKTPTDSGASAVLPEIKVTAPRRVARHTKPRPAPGGTGQAVAAPAAVPTEPTLAGTLPVVTNRFGTITVVPAEEIKRNGASTLGDLLFDKPGITGSSFAPGASSRPIIRGLDMHRVEIRENGIGAHGASDLGEDHGVPIDPLAARQVEVIRGPEALRYGSQAIGGVVNADNNRIPSAIPPGGFTGESNAAW